MSKYDELPQLTDEDARKTIVSVLINMAALIMIWIIILSVLALSFFT